MFSRHYSAILTFVVFLTTSSFCLGQTLAVSNGSGAPGERALVAVSLSSAPAETAGVNGTLTYDSSILTDPIVRAGDKAYTHVVEYNEKQPGELRFVIYKDPTAQFGAGDSNIALISFLVSASASVGASTNMTLITTIPGDPNINGTAVAQDDGSVVSTTLQGGIFTVANSQYPLNEGFGTLPSGWQFYPGQSPFTAPTSASGSGSLDIQATDNVANFGYWVAPASMVPNVPDSVYKASFTVLTDETDRSLVPQFRLRHNTGRYHMATICEVRSMGTGTDQLAPPVAGDTYDLLFKASPADFDTGNLLSFDLINLNDPFNTDAPTATVMLDSLVVSVYEQAEIDAGMSLASVGPYTFEGADTEGWTFSPVWPTVGTLPSGLHNQSEDTLETHIANNGPADPNDLASIPTTSDFAYWHTGNVLTLESGKLYAITFKISTDVTPRSSVPRIRMRLNDQYEQLALTFDVFSEGGGNVSPTADEDETEYTLFYATHPQVAGRTAHLSLDHIGMNNADSASGIMSLHSVVIKEGDAATLLP